jgi:hypothetical protein
LSSGNAGSGREGIICIVGDQMLPKSAQANHQLSFVALHIVAFWHFATDSSDPISLPLLGLDRK